MIFDPIKSAVRTASSAPEPLTGIGLADRLSQWGATLATLCIVTVALGAGLAAAYGRELQAGRAPTRSWWVARLLLLPLLAIGATAASETFALSRSTTAFTAAMLSLGGYDCLRLMESYWRARAAAMIRPEPEADKAHTPPPAPDGEASRG